MYVLVSYDIVDNRVRTRLMKYLKEYGNRIQQSVFECDLDDAMYRTMMLGAEKIINEKVDRVRYYRLCKGCIQRVVISGWGEVEEDEGFELI
ncbi:MAG: CRISPR-associated endonuclease Cas2 [Syntrophobacteraceae bacterium]